MKGTGAGGEIKGTFCQGSHMNPKRQLFQAAGSDTFQQQRHLLRESVSDMIGDWQK